MIDQSRFLIGLRPVLSERLNPLQAGPLGATHPLAQAINQGCRCQKQPEDDEAGLPVLPHAWRNRGGTLDLGMPAFEVASGEPIRPVKAGKGSGSRLLVGLVGKQHQTPRICAAETAATDDEYSRLTIGRRVFRLDT